MSWSLPTGWNTDGWSKVAAGAALDSATTAWINAVKAANSGVDSVSANQKTRVNTLIVSLKGHGLFTKLDRLWLWTGESDHHQATIDIINLGVGVENGNLTSTGLSASGYTGNASTGYFDTGFNPGTAGGNYTSTAASTGVYMVTNRTSGGGQLAFGAQDISGNTTFLEAYRFAGQLTEINNGTISSGGGSGTDGFWVLTQLAGTASLYNWSSILGNTNGVAVGSVANASPAAPPANNFYFLAFDSNGSPASFDGATDTQGAGFIGGGLTSTEVANLAADLNAYMTSWGVNRF